MAALAGGLLDALADASTRWTESMVKVTSARIVATAGVVIYWVGMFLAGALAPSYSALHDFMSSLASRGSSVATLGVASLLVLAFLSWPRLRAKRQRG